MSNAPGRPYDRAPFYAFEPQTGPKYILCPNGCGDSGQARRALRGAQATTERYVLCPNGCGDYLIPPRELGQLGAMPVYQCDLCNERGQEPNVWTDGQLRVEATSQAQAGYWDSRRKGLAGKVGGFGPGGEGFNQELAAANHRRQERELDDRGIQIGPRGCFMRSAGVLSAKRWLKFEPSIGQNVRALSAGSGVSLSQVISLALMRAAHNPGFIEHRFGPTTIR